MTKVVSDGYVPGPKISDDELKAKFLNDAMMAVPAQPTAVS